MKEEKEYLLDGMTEDQYFDQNDPRLSFSYYEELSDIIKQAQKDVWNEAVKECAKNAEIEEYDEHMQFSPHVDEQSILQLLKE